MRLLFLTVRLPSAPLDGSRVRCRHLIAATVAAGGRADVLSLAEPGEDIGDLSRLCTRVSVVANPRPWRRRVAQLAGSWLRAEPYLVTANSPAEARRKVRALTADPAYDAVVAESPPLAAWVGVPPARLVIDAHDIGYDLMRRLAAAGHPLRRLFYIVQSRRMRWFEMRQWARATRVLAVSERDRDILRAVNPDTVLVPNGTEVPCPSPGPPPRAPALVFTGLMSYRANEDAVLWFCARVLPLLGARVPDVRLAIVGDRPTPRVRALASDRIEVTGRVEDVRPYLRAARVAVAPLRMGSGTRIKILEAMAHERPVVATPLGCEGLEVTPGTDILVGDSPEALCGNIVRLLEDDPFCRRIAAKGRALVEAKYDWEHIGRAFVESMWEVCSRPRRHEARGAPASVRTGGAPATARASGASASASASGSSVIAAPASARARKPSAIDAPASARARKPSAIDAPARGDQ